MRPEVTTEALGGPRSPVPLAAGYYARRAWRWWRVLSESRPGALRQRDGQRRVLIVRLDGIGDFVLWSGAARALRRWLGPDAHVTLAANALWADLARDADIADDVWPVHRDALERDGSYRSHVRKRVAGAGFSLAINPRLTREMMFDDSMLRWSRAPERIGSQGEGHLLPDRERRWADGWYTRLVPASAESMHETERHAEFLRALGVPMKGVPAPSLAVLPQPFPGLDGLSEGFFVLFPGASLAEKRWGPAEFATVARHVQRATGWRPVLLGAPEDGPMTQAVAGFVPGAMDLSGTTSVPALAAAISRSRLVICNDTSAVHLAAATGVPVVCVEGGWHWRRFLPYPRALGEIAERVEVVSMVQEMPCFGCNTRCVLPHVAGQALPCVSRVPVERVIEAVDRVLSRLTVVHSNG